ncbi:uncharacterized protein LOC141502050 isoform X3 [Macrotis lagotis]|uniref:uncharacterized protein LOC141502050 isoform X3 n=1 Tax=Macrotis lagotis TaxID=92651 RepID=UPI003D69996E
MEVLDEFDLERPLTCSFCELISEEAFELQAVAYTARALRHLLRSVERTPALAERVLRKWKQEERERRGLVSFLTGRFFQILQGDLNRYNNMGAPELRQRLDHLKRRMLQVNAYAQDARLKRKKKEIYRLHHSQSAGSSILSQLPGAQTTSSRPSIPVTYMPRVFGPFPPLSNEQTDTLAGPNSEVKVMQLNWTGLSAPPKRSLGLGSTTDLKGLALKPGNTSVFNPTMVARIQPAQRPSREDPESDCDNKSLDSPNSAPQ